MKKLSEYPGAQVCPIYRAGELIGYNMRVPAMTIPLDSIVDVRMLPLPVCEAVDALVDAARAVAKRLRIEEIPLEIKGDDIYDVGEWLETALKELDNEKAD